MALPTMFMKILRCFLIATWSSSLALVGQTSGLHWETNRVSLKGDVAQEKLVAVFPFRNTGDGEVRIVEVEPSCDCMAVKPQKEIYRPGESGEIRAELDTAALSGVQTRTLKVVTMPQASGPTTLTVEVEMPERIVLSSRFLHWTPDGTTDEKQVDITIRAPEVVKLLGFESNNPFFDVRLETGASVGTHHLRVRPRALDLGEATAIKLDVQIGTRRQTYLVFAAVTAKAPASSLPSPVR